MVIEKAKLFENTRERWPATVYVRPSKGVLCFVAEPSLVDVYEAVEGSCAPSGEWTAEDEWTHLANWSFHQALWALAERSAERQLHRNDVTFHMFDERMRFNLSDECWNAERIEYEESPSRFD
ncbi:hypothetical protein [Blastomonas sp. AAP53]|uniref:hypothetical protein n=1 Tax=Blastomonas sp. AAP53 TaxID=1248760 RepID=UPI001267331B|nr:hypothetical protein [Blastomonas sp. AAP53]